MTPGDDEVRVIGPWSIQRVSVRIMWALLIGGLVAFAFGSSGTSGTAAVVVMVISYVALTLVARSRS